MAGNCAIETIAFYKNATAVSDGVVYNVNSDASTLNVDFVKGTSETTFTANFEAKVSEDSEWDAISAWNRRTLDCVTKAETDDTYEIDVTGISYFRIRLSAISGTVSTYGKAVG